MSCARRSRRPDRSGTILALNCGSSSIKFAVYDEALVRLLNGQVDRIGTGGRPELRLSDAAAAPIGAEGAGHAEIVADLIAELILPRAGSIRAVGHRVVHGGRRFAAPVRVDAASRAAIAALAPLAPAHQTHNLAGIDAVAQALPGVAQVACFDTAFHRTIPEHRQLMPLPARFAEEGLRRYGFHGLSFEHVASRLPEALGERAGGCVVVCHLGNGCSLAGLAGGRSAYTSMGFTPLDGLVMGQRPGRLDPGAVLWLVERHSGDTGAVQQLLNRNAGLLGISGLSSDMRVLLGDDGAAARLAIAMFLDRLVQEIGAAATAIGGLDALVFTGGIGENAAPIRASTLDALAWLGFALDPAANAAGAFTITATGASPSAHVIPADEEIVIARAARRTAVGP